MQHAGLTFALHEKDGQRYVVHTDTITGRQTYIDVAPQGLMNDVAYHAIHLKPAMKVIADQVKARRRKERKAMRVRGPATVQ